MLVVIKTIKSTWRFLADLGGVLSTIGILIYSAGFLIPKVISLFKDNVLLTIIFLIASALSVAFLIRTLKDRLTKLIDSIKKDVAINSLRELEQITRGDVDITKLIPSRKLLQGFLDLATQESKRWASDAKLGSYNLYIRVGMEVDLTIQIFFFSEWKKEELAVYYPNFSKDIERLRFPKEELKMPFFTVQNWLEAVFRAYNKASSKLKNKFELTIHCFNDEEFHITIKYGYGEVKDEFSFTVKDNKLLCREDNSKLELP